MAYLFFIIIVSFPFLYKYNLSKRSKTEEKVITKKVFKQRNISNQISFRLSKSKKRYYKFGTFRLFLNNNKIIEEKNIAGCLVCHIDYGKSVNFIIGKNTRLEYENFKVKLPSKFNDYFVILKQAFESGEMEASIQDPNTHISYAFKTKIFYNGELIKEIRGHKQIPLINSFRELQFKTYKEDINGNFMTIGKRSDSIENLNELYEQIKQCPIVDEDNVYFYFYKKECLPYYMAMEICKNADELNILQNKFNDDVYTINYCAKFSKSKIDDIDFLHYCLDKRFGSKIFYSTVYSQNLKSNSCGGYAIYKIPCIDYFRGLEGKYEFLNKQSQHLLTPSQKNNYKSLVELVYEKYNEQVNFETLPNKFLENIVCEDFMYDKIQKFLFDTYYNRDSISNNTLRFEKLKQKYNNLKQYLFDNNIIKSKWKSEFELFILLSSLYPDAIYQYHDKWLGYQSLDIFIPSQNIAFEYQGIQHYEPIEIWGGEKGLKKRKILDQNKRELCIKQNVVLIEWKYNEPINKITLNSKLKNLTR